MGDLFVCLLPARNVSANVVAGDDDDFCGYTRKRHECM